MVSLGNVLLLSSALDFRTYQPGYIRPHEETSEMQVSRDHFMAFRRWFLARYAVIDAQNPCEDRALRIFDVSHIRHVATYTECMI